ncbi:MAG TPA: hypothetical protein PKK40_08575 [Marmoricola sp.]|nr:hypothetical protein [Marmoricola sp.]
MPPTFWLDLIGFAVVPALVVALLVGQAIRAALRLRRGDLGLAHKVATKYRVLTYIWLVTLIAPLVRLNHTQGSEFAFWVLAFCFASLIVLIWVQEWWRHRFRAEFAAMTAADRQRRAG